MYWRYNRYGCSRDKSGKKIIVLSSEFSDTVIMYRGGYVAPKVEYVKRVHYNDEVSLQDILENWKEYF